MASLVYERENCGDAKLVHIQMATNNDSSKKPTETFVTEFSIIV